MLCWLEHFVFAYVLFVLLQTWYRAGVQGVTNLLLSAASYLPGYRSLSQEIISGQVKSYIKEIDASDDASTKQKIAIPKQGVPCEELLKEMEKMKQPEKNPGERIPFEYVHTGDDEHFNLQKKAFAIFTDKTSLTPDHDEMVRLFHSAFMHENALNPMEFPSLRKMENEVVRMTASMLNGDSQVVGCMTSGGTESLLMAIKTYRDRARDLKPHIRYPEMVGPITIHPAHEKAAHYFGVTIIHIPVDASGRPNVNDYRNAITGNTIALLSSAPQYCHGVVDPIPDIARIAVEYDLPLHVDSCFGGFMLPWVEKLGYPVPPFDFRVNGVTSMSADVHKYGYAYKGASVILYRNESYRKYQIYAYSRWPGGLYGSPSMAGSRPGGNIAAAWVSLKAMGEDGFMSIAKELMEITQRLRSGLSSIPGLYIVGNPHMTGFALASDDPEVDILVVADVMEKKGWTMDRQQYPSSLHFTIYPRHKAGVDQIVEDFRQAADEARRNKSLSSQGSAAMYGMMGRIPDTALLDEFVVQFFSQLYKA